MKKIIIVVLLISLVSTLLTGCIQWDTSVQYELLQDISNIKSIRIYNENEMSYDYSDPVEPCGELLGEIPSEQFDAFTKELTGLPFLEHHIIFLFPVAYDPNFYYLGPIVKIEYNDGSCELISDSIQRQFKVNEEYPDTIQYGVEEECWLAFLRNWVDLPDD